MYAPACCPDCAASHATTIGAASLFAIDDPTRPAQSIAMVDPAAQQRETFDDFMSLVSLLSIVINLTR